MSELQIETIKKIVYTFGSKANITDTDALNWLINELLSININDSIDRILVSLNDLVNKKTITIQDVFDNVDMLVKLNPEKYQNSEDLIQRLNWIKGIFSDWSWIRKISWRFRFIYKWRTINCFKRTSGQ